MIWFALIFVFLIIEAITVNLVTIWFAFGSICAYITSYFTENIIIQLIVFVLSSTISLILTKPFLKKYMKKKHEKTNIDRIIGQTGVVTKDIKKASNATPHQKPRVTITNIDTNICTNAKIP